MKEEKDLKIYLVLERQGSFYFLFSISTLVTLECSRFVFDNVKYILESKLGLDIGILVEDDERRVDFRREEIIFLSLN